MLAILFCGSFFLEGKMGAQARLVSDAPCLELAWALIWQSEVTNQHIEATRSKKRFSVREKTTQVPGKESCPQIITLHPDEPITILGVALRHGTIQRRIECAWPYELCADGTIVHAQKGSIRVTPLRAIRDPYILQARTYQQMRFPVSRLLPESKSAEDIISVCHIYSYRIAAFEDYVEAQRFRNNLLAQKN